VIVWKREAYLCRPPMRISMVLLQFLWKLHVLPPSAGRKRRNDNDKAAMTAYIATNLLLSLVGLSMSKHYINELAGVFFSYGMSLLYQRSWASHVHTTCKIVMDPISTSTHLNKEERPSLYYHQYKHTHMSHTAARTTTGLLRCTFNTAPHFSSLSFRGKAW